MPLLYFPPSSKFKFVIHSLKYMRSRKKPVCGALLKVLVVVKSIFEFSISEAKDYFLKTFYREAPIPRALRLAVPDSVLSYQNNPATAKFLDRELNLYLKSGASLLFRFSQNVHFNLIYSPQKNLIHITFLLQTK